MSREVTRSRQLPITEDNFTNAVISLAQYRRWLVCHFRAGRTAKGWRTPIQGDKGFPDLVLVRDGRLILAELKTATGKMRPDQERWHDVLTTVSGIEVYLWRPADLNETIPEVLR